MLETIAQVLREKLRPLEARVRAVVVRGVLRALADDEGLARGQFSLMPDEVEDGVVVVTPHGLVSRPLAGAEALVFAPGGDPAGRMAIVFDRRKRLVGGLEEGEAALYIGTSGQVVRLKANGDVVITAAPGASIYLGQDGATKKFALADDVDARFAAVQAKFDAHVHAGVTVGMGSTAVTPTPIGPLAPTGSSVVKGV